VVSAPVIRESITGGTASITGDFSRQEAEAIVANLNAYRNEAEAFLEEMDKEPRGRAPSDGLASKPSESDASTSDKAVKGGPLLRAWHAKTPLEFGEEMKLTLTLRESAPLFFDTETITWRDLPKDPDQEEQLRAWAVEQGYVFEFRTLTDGRFEFRTHEMQTAFQARLPADSQTIEQWPDTVEDSGHYKIDPERFGTRSPREVMQSMFDSSWAAIRFPIQGAEEDARQMRNQQVTFDRDALPAIIEFWDGHERLGLMRIERYDPENLELKLRFKRVILPQDL
jgi:hypothetical protein